MNERCEIFRELIESSVSGELTGDEQSTLDGHLQGCTSCKQYLDDLKNDDILLRGYAGLFEDHVSEIGRAAALPGLSRRNMFMRPRFVLTAAATIILIAVTIYSISIRTSTPAFARVLEEIRQAEDVSYTQIIEVEGMDPIVSNVYVNGEGVIRSEMSTGTVLISDFTKGIQLTLHPEAKKANILHRHGGTGEKGLFNYFDWMVKLHKELLDDRGTENLNDNNTNLFVHDSNPHSIYRIWTDEELGLPVKIVHVSTPHPDTTIISPMLFLEKSSFGIESEESMGTGFNSNTGISLKTTTTKNDFNWNSGLDESLFNVKPPEGYTVEEDSLDTSVNIRTDVIDALSQWTIISGGSFPDDINDLANQKIAEPLLVEAYNSNGDPEEDFNAAMTALNVLVKGCFYAQQMKVVGSWHYSGKGIMLGDKDAPVCWWKEKGSDNFKIIYGDLRIENIEEKDLPEK